MATGQCSCGLSQDTVTGFRRGLDFRVATHHARCAPKKCRMWPKHTSPYCRPPTQIRSFYFYIQIREIYAILFSILCSLSFPGCWSPRPRAAGPGLPQRRRAGRVQQAAHGVAKGEFELKLVIKFLFFP